MEKDEKITNSVISLIITDIGFNYDASYHDEKKQYLIEDMNAYVACYDNKNHEVKAETIAEQCLNAIEHKQKIDATNCNSFIISIDLVTRLLKKYTFVPHVAESQYINIDHEIPSSHLAKYFAKLIPFKIDSNKKRYLVPKSNLYNAYLWTDKPISDDDLTDLDKKFIADPDSLPNSEKLVIYGYHDHNGYHGFFKPDLNEVIHFLNTKIQVEDLDNIDKIYVTTDTHPTGHPFLCYNDKLDKHRGMTTFYICRNNSSRKRHHDDII